MKKLSVYVLITSLTFVGLACQEDEPKQTAPLLPLPELLTQGLWQVEQYTIQLANEPVETISLDYCDIDSWAFHPDLEDPLFIIYVHYRAVFSQGEECDQSQYRMVQSYQLNGDELVLKGPWQEFTEDWDSFGFAVSNLRIEPITDEKIRIIISFEGSDPEVTGGKHVKGEITQTFFLSSRSE